MHCIAALTEPCSKAEILQAEGFVGRRDGDAGGTIHALNGDDVIGRAVRCDPPNNSERIVDYYKRIVGEAFVGTETPFCGADHSCRHIVILFNPSVSGQGMWCYAADEQLH